MKCEYCGNEILPGSEVVYDGHIFCNSLDRKLWKDSRAEGQSIAEKKSLAAKKFRITGQQWGWIVGAVLTAIGTIVGTKLASGFFESGGSFDKQLMAIASDLNKSCPIMVDENTRLDNTVAGSGKTFIYSYTLVNWSIQDINITELRDYLQPRIINIAKTSEEMKVFRENNVTLQYIYSDKAGIFVIDFKVTPDDYK